MEGDHTTAGQTSLATLPFTAGQTESWMMGGSERGCKESCIITPADLCTAQCLTLIPYLIFYLILKPTDNLTKLKSDSASVLL